MGTQVSMATGLAVEGQLGATDSENLTRSIRSNTRP